MKKGFLTIVVDFWLLSKFAVTNKQFLSSNIHMVTITETNTSWRMKSLLCIMLVNLAVFEIKFAILHCGLCMVLRD